MSYSKEQIKDLLLIREELDDLVDFFKLFSDQTRLKILQALSFESLCVTDICEITNLSQSAVSHQLATLRRMRVVKTTKKGKSVFYELQDLHIMNIFNNALTHIKE